MANPEPSYFFPPSWNFQLNGAIKLGNIITDPKKPQSYLNEDNRSPLPALIIDHTKPTFHATITADTTRSAGVGSSLLQLFGFAADLTLERGKHTTWTIAAEQLLTQEIDPKPAWVETCFAHPEVQRELQQAKYRRDLYMVVGVMAASAATVSSEVGTRRLFATKLGVNLAPVAGGVPVEVHVEGKVGGEKGVEAGFGKSDFVLAYKIRKISYLKTMRVKKMSDVTKGTVLDGDAVGEEVEKEAVFELLKLDADDVGADEFDLEAVTARVDAPGSEGGSGSGSGGLQFVLPED